MHASWTFRCQKWMGMYTIFAYDIVLLLSSIYVRACIMAIGTNISSTWFVSDYLFSVRKPHLHLSHINWNVNNTLNFYLRFEATHPIRTMESKANEQMNGGIRHGWRFRQEGWVACPYISHDSWCNSCTYEPYMQDGWMCRSPLRKKNLYWAVATASPEKHMQVRLSPPNFFSPIESALKPEKQYLVMVSSDC